MKKKFLRRTPALVGLLLASRVACADPTYQFDIPGSTLEAALKQFASQTGLQIAYFTKIAEGRDAPAVSGTLTAEQALRTLLNASGLTFERIDEGTIAIHSVTSRPAAAAISDPTAMQSQRSARSFRLASAAGAAQPESTTLGRDTQRTASDGRDVLTLDEVIVTGSHIRGVQNETTPVLTFDRDYIERSGYSNMMQLVESLPMNFKGGPAGSSEVAPFGLAPNYGQNLTRGTGFNLRGLGSVSTLTLINGRRVAPSAHGQFVDVSTIPLSAVERVEILTDGASATYGADAVAGVVNIILRRDFEGAETSAHYGQTTDGALDEQRVSQTVGTAWDSGNALVTAELYKRDPLDVADRDFMVEAGAIGPTHLLPRRKLGSLLFALNQELGEKVDLSTHALYSYEEVDMWTTDEVSTFHDTPFTNRWSVALGLGYEAFSDWRVALDVTAAQQYTKSSWDSYDPETMEHTLIVRDYKDRFETGSLDLKADGSLFTLPGGSVRLAIGASYREDDLRSTRIRVLPPIGFQVRAIDARDVTSAYAELYVPIVGEQQGIAGAKRVDLSIAGRHDDYSDFGSTTNPKVGIVWTPVEGLDLRAAYGTSFRAPTVAEKALATRGGQISTGLLAAPDGSAWVPIFYLSGSTALTAEEAETIAVGFTLRPQSVPGFELSVNYFDIDYTDRISSPPADDGVLARRDEFGDLIFDIADDAAAQAYLDARIAAGDIFIDWEGTGSTGVRYVFDGRQKNAARTQTSGFDVTASYSFQRQADTFDFNLSVSRLDEILTSLTRSTTAFDQIDLYNQPLDWRARAMGTWNHGGFGTTLAINYADDYVNDSLVLDVPVDSWTTIDLNLSYDFSSRMPGSWWDGTKIALSVINVLDEEPPFAAGPSFLDALGYDVFNADGLGRFMSARFTKRW